MANGRTMDAPFTGQFVFSVDGVGEIGAFVECTGLSVEVTVALTLAVCRTPADATQQRTGPR